jgi:hypothetical protein
MGRYISSLSSGSSSSSSGSGFKESIVLFDVKPGTRSITLAAGIYRVAVVGGGGTCHATPGSGAGGTSVWDTTMTATGGAAKAVGGVGSGGTVNTSGQSTVNGDFSSGGGASGHRLGSPPDLQYYTNSTSGGGWNGSIGGVDGFGLGIAPGSSHFTSIANGYTVPTAGYGVGGATGPTNSVIPPGIGGGGARTQHGGVGGGGAGSDGVADYSGSGGGYAEKIITVPTSTAFTYTVGAGGVNVSDYGGNGAVIVERL